MTFEHTRRACYAGYVTLAIVNNLVPLLFIVFQTRYAISYEMLGRLILLNFGTQLFTDFVALNIVDRTGYRAPMILAHALCFVGLLLLAVLPSVLPSPYLGLSVGIVVYAIGGGLLEVLVSPVVEALPNPEQGLDGLGQGLDGLGQGLDGLGLAALGLESASAQKKMFVFSKSEAFSHPVCASILIG